MRILLAAAAMLAGLAGAFWAERVVTQSSAQVQLSYAPVVSRVAPAVANVYSRRTVRQAVNPFFQQYFGAGPQRSRVEQSLGSGVIILAVDYSSQAARFGFRQGGLVRTINGERIANVAQLARALEGADGWRMTLQRGDQTLNLAVR